MMFFSSVKDEKVSRTELRFMRIGSRAVWIGLSVLVLSGIGLFLLDSEAYLQSTKFLAKMTIVGIIIANGIFFHTSHLPRIERHVDTHFPSSDEFVRNVPLLVASGVVSLVSWGSAFVLGLLRSIPLTLLQIIVIYLTVVVIAVSFAVMIRRRLVPHLPR